MQREELYKKWKERPLSWSQISSFEYDPEQWYRSYFLGNRDAPSEEMLFGSKVGKKLEKDPEYLPMIPREDTMEYEFKAVHKRKGKSDIVLTGYADSFGKALRRLREYKTGVKAWDQKRVDNHGQITMYLYMEYLNEKINPDDYIITLHWMPTRRMESGDFTVTIDFVPNIEENIQHFTTKRTVRQLLEFGQRINDTVDAMEAYIQNHE